MRVAEGEIVMRETFKGRLNAWVGSKVSSRNASPDALHEQKGNLQSYGEHVATQAAHFAHLHQQCKQAEGSGEVYASAEELFDAIAKLSGPDVALQRDPEVERLFGREDLGDAGAYTDRVVTSLATVSAMPMRLQREMPYQSASIIARYGTEIVIAALGSLATGAYVVLGGEPARKQVIGSTTMVAHSAYAQVSDSLRTLYNLVAGKEQHVVQAASKWNPINWIPAMNPKTILSKRLHYYYNSLVQPKIELTKAAGLTTMIGTAEYKPRSPLYQYILSAVQKTLGIFLRLI